MAIRDYIPKKDETLRTWLLAFKDNATETGASLGLTADEIADIEAITAELADKIQAVKQAKINLKVAATARKTAQTGTLGKLRRYVRRIKAHPDYTTAMGRVYRIMSSRSAWNPLEEQPGLRAAIVAGKVVLKYKKRGSHGIKIWCRRGAETEYTFLAIDINPPYYDNRPNLGSGPEERSYYAIFIDGKDAEVSQRSNVVTVNV